MAQVFGKSARGLAGNTLQIQWLRYSGHAFVVCRIILGWISGPDAREILLLYAGTYFENLMAQILWKSFCCMQEHVFKI